MIAYSSMTVAEAIDEILDKVSHFQTATNLDLQTIWMFINRARREVFARTLAFKDYAYIKSADVVHGDALPADFSRPIRVIARDGGVGEYTECRQAAPKEWWTMTNAARPNLINGATPKYPIYMIWGSDNDPLNDETHIYLAPDTEEGKLEYYAAYSDLPVNVDNEPVLTAQLNVPYEFENLVIQSALLRCYARIAEKGKLAEAFANVQAEYAKLRKNYMAKASADATNAKALPDPEPSMTPPTSLIGGNG